MPVKVSFHFVSAPLLAKTGSESQTNPDPHYESSTAAPTSTPRTWYFANKSPSEPLPGLDATLLWLTQLFATHNYAGIISFSQGASVASILPQLGPRFTRHLRFLIFISGYPLPPNSAAGCR